MSIRWSPATVALPDGDYDRERASDGLSRFGVYLRQNAAPLTDPGWPLSAAEFAASVWRIATEPVMSPGYIRTRPDLRAITPAWDEATGKLLFEVHLPLPHQALADRRAVPPRWRDWQHESVFGEDEHRWWAEPDGGRPAVLTTCVIRLPVDDSWHLPEPGHLTPGHALTVAAKQSVAAVAARLNEHAGPVVAALRSGKEAR
ncbi:hypothetical protein [Streptomyces sp. ICBB 8177]|uniref:hypothetical protein n=1 Tax=Streptomyces sp. ICBB 8177 TaxID=563922 RepID=UPI000D672C96|nr:hypothetical protein [Streptomyces sp. ICBB 8177]PWI43193.1 hypothetical protein CK485_13500 [Streptomyces sp. ICBB 8177]